MDHSWIEIIPDTDLWNMYRKYTRLWVGNIMSWNYNICTNCNLAKASKKDWDDDDNISIIADTIYLLGLKETNIFHTCDEVIIKNILE